MEAEVNILIICVNERFLGRARCQLRHQYGDDLTFYASYATHNMGAWGGSSATGYLRAQRASYNVPVLTR